MFSPRDCSTTCVVVLIIVEPRGDCDQYGARKCCSIVAGRYKVSGVWMSGSVSEGSTQ